MKYRIIHILKHKRKTQRIKDSKSLCGKSYYGNAIMTDFSQPGTVCQVCDRISANCYPGVACLWSWSWSREEMEPFKSVRETAKIGNVLITALHSRNLTRMWFRYDNGKTKHNNAKSVKFLSSLAKTWVDTRFYRSVALQEYLDQMFNDQ